MTNYRVERDSLGEISVPEDALYGGQTVRASQNFVFTRQGVNRQFLHNLATVKRATAYANYRVGQLDAGRYELINLAAQEVEEGQHDDAFITDAIQGGAGTSINMNMNEVIANRAAQLIGVDLGRYERIHPNDHVNMSQSTNDTIPTAAKLTVLDMADTLLTELDATAAVFEGLAETNRDVIKVGRTHLQDAVPVSMGQVFTSNASFIHRQMTRLALTLDGMMELNLGGTAVGTEVNTVQGYRVHAINQLRELSGYTDLVSAEDLVDATRHLDGFLDVHAQLKSLATGLSRMANDLRLMASGPKAGLAEIKLPAVQPGSSIMPGKVNPVILEAVNQVCFQVMGNDTTVTMAAEAGQMELNVFEPVLFYNLFQSFDLLISALTTLRTKALDGLVVNREACEQAVESSLIMATALVKPLGYAKAAELTKAALATGTTLRYQVVNGGYLSAADADNLLDPSRMVGPETYVVVMQEK